MIDLLVPLVGFATVATVTPGPNNVMLAASGLNFGFRRSVAHIAGVSLGFPVMVLLVGVGLAEIFSNAPYLHLVLKIGASLYLLYLAWKIATAPVEIDDAPSRGRPMRFHEAVAFQWINPKGWVMAVGAISSYTTMKGDTFLEVAVIAAIFLIVGVPSSALWAGLGVAIRRWLSSPRHVRVFNITMAILLVACLVPLAIE